ncbi:MAG: bifunctional 5,10-methylenetetrahydrofolate dehydrogenase/5,10-methenyltetrahydrofolate cyclohydrolase [Tissierellia bacterium]|nr:bifunctional 5,10-methylenetetrahydrofolate dehydrogenase/5,10-methenyltetrahydrofolate cyclohydrolase [Tissierellia bacterium]
MANILKGKAVADKIKEEIAAKLKDYNEFPKLAIIRIGEDPSDISYERGMIKACESVNMPYESFKLASDVCRDEFLNLINKLNTDNEYSGIMPLRPFPKQINSKEISELINPLKDVDCINSENLNRLFSGNFENLLPCTPNAIMKLLEFYDIDLKSKTVLIMNRTEVVGKPLVMMMLKEDASVIITHSKSDNEKVKKLSKSSDIVVCAVGKAEIFDMQYFTKDSIVIDVGMSENEDGKLCGDVKFDEVSDKVKYITPVFGGIGSVTTACLLKNNLIAGINLLER